MKKRTPPKSPAMVASAQVAYPVDKGWAWSIVVGAFGIHFFTFGYIRSFGILFLEFQNKFGASSAETAVISGVQFCAYSLANLFVVNVILKRFSIRQCCLAGSVLESLGIALNGIVPDIKYLILTQGVLFGFGQALTYCPALIIVSEYFNKKRAIATVIATCGVSAGGISLPLLMRYLVDMYGLTGGLFVLSAAMLNQAVFSSLFTPTNKYVFITPTDRSVDRQIYKIVDSEDAHTEQTDTDNTQIHTKSSKHNQQFDSCIEHTDDVKDNNLRNHQLYTIPPSSSESEHLLELQLKDNHISPKNSDQLSESFVSSNGSHCSLQENVNNIRIQNSRTRASMELLNTIQFLSVDHSELANKCENNVSLISNLHETPTAQRSETEGLLNEKQRADNNCEWIQDQSRKSSLKSVILSAIAASSTDLHGSFNNITHLGAPGLNTNNHIESSQSEPKRRYRCHVPDVIKTVPFWAVLVFFACGSVASGLPPIFMPPLAKEKKVISVSTIMLIVSAVTEFFGRLIPGFIIQAGLMRASTVVIFPMAVCATIYQFTEFYNDYGTLLAMAIVGGLFTGPFWSTQSLVVIEVFGLKKLGQMLGFYFLVLGLSLGTSHPIAGLIRDISGTYVATFHYFGVLYYTAAAMMVIISFRKGGRSPV